MNSFKFSSPLILSSCLLQFAYLPYQWIEVGMFNFCIVNLAGLNVKKPLKGV